MTYIERRPVASPLSDHLPSPKRQPLLVVVEDGDAISTTLQPICDFLEIGVEQISSEMDVGRILREFCPMGVVAALDCRGQDGCHVMITVANYDRTLPILIVTGPEEALAGAADAVEEVWGLESVLKVPAIPSIGGLVNFIFKAGRKGQCIRMVPV